MRYQQYKTSFSQTWEGRLFIYEDKTQNEQYAFQKYIELLGLCRYCGIPVPRVSGSIFESVAAMSESLFQWKVRHSVIVGRSGQEMKDYWSGVSKGMDDYLASGGTVEQMKLV